MHGEHIFADKEKITGIIDLERMQAGDPRYDVAMSFIFQTERQQEHFKEGYGELANDPMVLKYLIIIAAEKIKFRMKVNRTDSAAEKLGMLRKMLAEVE